MEHRSVAEQEMFLPDSEHDPNWAQREPVQTQQRFYAGLHDRPVQDSNETYQPYHPEQPAARVPDINLISPTPSASRSSTIRSTPTTATDPKVMTGALPELTEEDDLYGAPPSTTAGASQVPQSQHNAGEDRFLVEQRHTHQQSGPAETYLGQYHHAPQRDSAFHDNGAYPEGSVPHANPPLSHEQTSYGSVPMQPQLLQSEDAAYSNMTSDGAAQSQGMSAPPHPPTYDEYRASKADEQPPPLPGPRPPVPQSSGHGQDSSIHPSVHLDSDQDYALALQLQEEEEGRPPPLPQRPARPAAAESSRAGRLSSHNMTAEEQDHALAMRLQEEENSASQGLPIRQSEHASSLAPRGPAAFTRTPSTEQFLPPPRRQPTEFGTDSPSDPTHYIRDPHKLVAYLIPFPRPHLTKAPSESIPQRFLIYTPPPPPLQAPPEGVKEERVHKVQRKWQTEVRNAKASEAKATSWAGFRAKMTRGVNKGMQYTTTSNIDFLSRIQQPGQSTSNRTPSPSRDDAHFNPDDPAHQSLETKKTIGVEEMVFVYSPAMNLTPDGMREEFVNTVMRTKSKAMRDSVIATGLLPISLAVDIVLIAVSGLFEVNAAWAYFNIKGAKTARSVGKRLSSSTTTTNPETIDPEKPDAEMQKEDKLKLDFRPAPRVDVLTRYLNAECHRVDGKYFPEFKAPPTESDCLEAIGWAPHQTGGQQNWEDEAWELSEVKDDLRIVMHKAAKEWRKYCVAFEKNPEKNLNK